MAYVIIAKNKKTGEIRQLGRGRLRLPGFGTMYAHPSAAKIAKRSFRANEFEKPSPWKISVYPLKEALREVPEFGKFYKGLIK